MPLGADERIRTPDPRFTNVTQGSGPVQFRPVLISRVGSFSSPEQPFSAGIVPQIVPRHALGEPGDPSRLASRVGLACQESTCLAAKWSGCRRLRERPPASHTEHQCSAQSAIGGPFFLGLVVTLVVNSTPSAPSLRVNCQRRGPSRQGDLSAQISPCRDPISHQIRGPPCLRSGTTRRRGSSWMMSAGAAGRFLSNWRVIHRLWLKPMAASAANTGGPGSNSGGGHPHTHQNDMVIVP